MMLSIGRPCKIPVWGDICLYCEGGVSMVGWCDCGGKLNGGEGRQLWLVVWYRVREVPMVFCL